MMCECISGLLSEVLDSLMKGPAASHLFNINSDVTPLSTTDAVHYHHLFAKLLYLAKLTHPDILLTISFLTTCVQSPDDDNFQKLG